MPAPDAKATTVFFGFDLSPMSLGRMLWKSKLVVLVIWVVITAITVVVVQRIPAIYTASALIILDSQKIPEKFVSATVNTDVQDRFATISQHLLSTSQLQKIISQFNLYPEERKKRFPEEILEMMRADISITPEKTVNGTRPGAFRISYQGPNRTVVAQVVNQIANLYIDENLKTREVQAEGTSEFLDAQLRAAKEKLDEMEASLSAYKVQHNGELPQQESTLNGMLNRLQVELEANRDALNRSQTSRVSLENALSIAEDSLSLQTRAADQQAGASSVRGVQVQSAAEPPAPKRSEVLRAELESLQLRYSDEHPDVIKLRRMLESAEAAERSQIATLRKPPSQAVRAEPAAPVSKPVRETPEIRQTRERIASLQSQLALARQEIEMRKNEQRRILSDIGAYQSRIARLPIREQEMAQVTRDYEMARANYKNLQEKKFSADMAADMERRQKAERFTIADPAHIPEVPSRPNRKAYQMGGSAAGLLIGILVGMGRELRKRTFSGEWQVPAGITVIGRLPAISHSSIEPTSGRGTWPGKNATLNV